MPSTIQSFFATIDPISPPPEQLRNLAFRQNQSHRNETFKLKLLRWRRRVLPPGLPAVRSEFQRHRLATGPYSTPHCTRQREQLPTRAGRIVVRADLRLRRLKTIAEELIDRFKLSFSGI